MNLFVTSDFIYRFIYLILKSVPIMRNDINKENFFYIFKKNRIINKIVGYCCRKKSCKQRFIHSPLTKSGVPKPSKS